MHFNFVASAAQVAIFRVLSLTEYRTGYVWIANKNKPRIPAPAHTDHCGNLSNYKLRILCTSYTHRYKTIL